MTARKAFAIVGLIVLVPAIAVVRAQMLADTPNTTGGLSRTILGMCMVLVPAFISESLWRSLQGWLPWHRTVKYHEDRVATKRTLRRRALIQYREITTRYADLEHEAQRLQAIYERAYREARNTNNAAA